MSYLGMTKQKEKNIVRTTIEIHGNFAETYIL